jgi:hypothetical protein
VSYGLTNTPTSISAQTLLNEKGAFAGIIKLQNGNEIEILPPVHKDSEQHSASNGIDHTEKKYIF